jgi:hypothetical protein
MDGWTDRQTDRQTDRMMTEEDEENYVRPRWAACYEEEKKKR